MDPHLLQSDSFNKAVIDYFYLLERGFPGKGALKLVGDRYSLQSELRALLYRGVSATVISEHRSNRIIQEPLSPLIIDGYNVLLTLFNYRLGHFVFISTDSICRDTGSLFGKIRNDILFADCMSLLCDFINQFKNLETIIYLDEPVSNSAIHKKILQSKLKESQITADVKLPHSADKKILMHTQGTIASSDSELIEQTVLPVLDIPHQILIHKFNADLFDLKEKIAELST
jgi:hypothetical protein